MRYFLIVCMMCLSLAWGEAPNKAMPDDVLEKVLNNVLTNVPKGTVKNVLKNTLSNAMYNAMEHMVYDKLGKQEQEILTNELRNVIDLASLTQFTNALNKELHTQGIQIPTQILDKLVENASRDALREILNTTLINNPNNLFVKELLDALPNINIPNITGIKSLEDAIKNLAGIGGLGNINIDKFNEIMDEWNDFVKEFTLNPMIALNKGFIEAFKKMISGVFNLFGIDFAWPCTDNTQSVVDSEKEDTKNIIKDKEGDLEDAIDAYEEALEKKRSEMTKLWKIVKRIEFLMKENQVLRKKTIKYWEDVKQSHLPIH